MEIFKLPFWLLSMAIPVWMLLESLLGALDRDYQRMLVAVFSVAGWCVYLLTIVIKRSFQRLRRTPA